MVKLTKPTSLVFLKILKICFIQVNKECGFLIKSKKILCIEYILFLIVCLNYILKGFLFFFLFFFCWGGQGYNIYI